MKPSGKNRRRFLQKAAAGILGAPFVGAMSGFPNRVDAGIEGVRTGVPRPGDTSHRMGGIPLGVASYSLRKFSREEAIAMIRGLGAKIVSVKSFHLPYDLSPAELAEAAEEFRRAGLTLASSGNNDIREDSDAHVGMFFEYARAAGIPMLVVAPKPDTLPRIERFAKSFDIRVAIHNHGPEDPHYPAPSDALALISRMDPRVGLCVDVGHTARTGRDVVQEIADAGTRVLDLHMKDLRDLSDKDSQCIVGEGSMPVADIFRQLVSMNYAGSVNLEYEIDEDNPLPGMKQSFAYMRGVLAGMEEERNGSY